MNFRCRIFEHYACREKRRETNDIQIKKAIVGLYEKKDSFRLACRITLTSGKTGSAPGPEDFLFNISLFAPALCRFKTGRLAPDRPLPHDLVHLGSAVTGYLDK